MNNNHNEKYYCQAIRYHDGQYVEENRCVAHKGSKLTGLLQYADNWSGLAVESRG